MTEERQQRDSDERTGKYGGDDGALEHERAELMPGEDSGLTGTPTGQAPQAGKAQARRKDLASDEEKPG